MNGFNDVIFQIVLEESTAYFNGDKTIEDTTNVIQNRVKTYINENR